MSRKWLGSQGRKENKGGTEVERSKKGWGAKAEPEKRNCRPCHWRSSRAVKP
jgi:hypothetical protein